MRNDTIDWEIKLKPKDSKQKSPYLSFNIEENRNEYTYVCYNLCPWTKNDTCQEPQDRTANPAENALKKGGGSKTAQNKRKKLNNKLILGIF